uniref:EamA domain-containing protein n=2 Tax=Prasinoderma singulare TaxID=676789 RepID=A0A7S3BKF3_9VIRI|mmetsp:Transcript_17783/g.55250  ORF Transcript_17783/g.55250 Transcript_17783/m.55250 type:complete len:440 (+) Transcript_17783:481-1800(+)
MRDGHSPRARAALEMSAPPPEPPQAHALRGTARQDSLAASANRVLTRKGWTLGLGLVVLVAVIWVAASYVVRAVVSAEDGMRPLLFTYICNVLFVIYIPVYEGYYFVQSRRTRHWRPLIDDATETPRPRMTLSGSIETQAQGDDIAETAAMLGAAERGGSGGGNDHAASELRASTPPDRRRTACVSLMVSPFWFFAQYLFNRSLQLTSVTSNTVLSSASSVLTFLLSVVVLKERFTYSKAGAVALLVLGTVAVGISDRREGGNNTLQGDFFCLLSACAYAIYTLMLRVKLPESNDVSMMLFFGYVGLCNAVLFAPWLMGEILAGVQPLDTVSAAAYRWTAAKGLVDNVLSDYLWAWAVLLTTPTVATIGLSVQIPIAMVTSLLIDDEAPTVYLLLGALLVTASFVWINLSSDPERRDALDERATRERRERYGVGAGGLA